MRTNCFVLILPNNLLGTWGSARCILIVGSGEIPESGASPKEEINGAQIRAFQHRRASTRRARTWSWGNLGVDWGAASGLVWPEHRLRPAE